MQLETNIFIFSYNRPSLLTTQVEYIQKNILGNINIIIVINNKIFSSRFKNICKKLSVEYLEVTNNPYTEGSSNHAYAINQAYNYAKNLEKNAIFLDHDVYPIKDIDLLFLSQFDLAGEIQLRGSIEYLYPGMLYISNNILKKFDIDFMPNVINGIPCDTGANTYNIVMNNKIFEFPGYRYVYLDDPEKAEAVLQYNDKLLNLTKASSWNDHSYSEVKKTHLRIKKVLNWATNLE